MKVDIGKSIKEKKLEFSVQVFIFNIFRQKYMKN